MKSRRYSAVPTRLTRRHLMRLAAATPLAAALPLAAAAPHPVVATTGMIADAAQFIGGPALAVKSLMGPGVDPHAYRQTRTDIVAMTRAELVLRHGLYLEAQMEDFFHQLAGRRSLATVTDDLPRDRLIAHTAYADKYDPHVWMAPDLWMNPVAAIHAALATAFPDSAAEFGDNATAYLDTCARLHGYAQQVLGTVPAAARVLVTAHDAFGYFGRAYGFEVIGIQGISTESEAGLSRIRDLVNLLVQRQIGAVFVESSVSDRNMRALIEGAGAQGHKVTIGGELFSDAMGEPGSYEGTYPGMIDHNVTTIAAALGGTVPSRGMVGKLAAGF